jgi:hypothetical protein
MLLWCEAVRRSLADALGIAWHLVPSAVVCAIAEKITGSDTFIWNVNRSMAGNGISIQRLHHARGVMSARITCTTSRLGSSHVNHYIEVWAGLPTSASSLFLLNELCRSGRSPALRHPVECHGTVKYSATETLSTYGRARWVTESRSEHERTRHHYLRSTKIEASLVGRAVCADCDTSPLIG